MLVAGLTLRMRLAPPLAGHEVAWLGGPAITAGLGARLHSHGPVRLATTVPRHLEPGDDELLTMVDPGWRACPSVERRDRPALTFVTSRVMRDSAGRVEGGDPAAWMPGPAALCSDAKCIALANGDPRWYARNLSKRAQLILVDVHGEWLPVRGSEFLTLIGLADVVFYNERDTDRLPPGALGKLRTRTCVVKRGSRGVRIRTGEISADLPPPELPGPLLTDVGAGDLLLGAVAGLLRASYSDDANLHSAVCEAYSASLPTVGRYLAGGLSEVLSGLRRRHSSDHAHR